MVAPEPVLELQPGRPVVVRAGPHDVLVSIDEAIALRLDAEGRWCSLREGATLYRRTVDGRVVAGTTAPVDLDRPEALHQRVVRLAARLRRLVEDRAAPLLMTASDLGPQTLAARLADAERWTPARFAAERARFDRVHPEPVRIVPPDRYQDVVVLPAVGCPWERCTFCAFYQGRRFRVLGEREFADHLAGVVALFGRALGLRTGAFLGSANALALDQQRLLSALRSVSGAVRELPRGVAAFWDPDRSPPRDRVAWEALREAGLSIVYAGLETGLGELRAAIGKPSDPARFVAATQAPRAAGLRLGVTVLVGVGEGPVAHEHHDATVEAVGAMRLGPDDLVYVSPLQGSRPEPELAAEATRLQAALRRATAARVAPYRMELFRYYA
jgi:hypothetical protein